MKSVQTPRFLYSEPGTWHPLPAGRAVAAARARRLLAAHAAGSIGARERSYPKESRRAEAAAFAAGTRGQVDYARACNHLIDGPPRAIHQVVVGVARGHLDDLNDLRRCARGASNPSLALSRVLTLPSS